MSFHGSWFARVALELLFVCLGTPPNPHTHTNKQTRGIEITRSEVSSKIYVVG